MGVVGFLTEADADIVEIRAIVGEDFQGFVGHVGCVERDLLQVRAPFRHCHQPMLCYKSSFVGFQE